MGTLMKTYYMAKIWKKRDAQENNSRRERMNRQKKQHEELIIKNVYNLLWVLWKGRIEPGTSIYIHFIHRYVCVFVFGVKSINKPVLSVYFHPCRIHVETKIAYFRTVPVEHNGCDFHTTATVVKASYLAFALCAACNNQSLNMSNSFWVLAAVHDQAIFSHIRHYQKQM